MGSSPVLLAALERARQAARSGADILLEAESGTGKELLARLIHDEVPAAGRPLVAINCAAVPENLLESELFGHVRGAFTGAVVSQPGNSAGLGRHAAAGRDWRNALGAATQAAAGSAGAGILSPGRHRPVSVDVRVIASTNRSLHLLVEEGQFPRRSVLSPERHSPGAAAAAGARRRRHRAGRVLCRQICRPGSAAPAERSFSGCPARLSLAGQCSRTGQYHSARRRLVRRQRDRRSRCRVSMPQASPAGAVRWLQPGLSLRELEKSLLEITLHATAGNRTHAAELLGVSLRTVRNKIREHGLPSRRLP